ncbi:MAG TPA: DegT/DnrJ/EryC1/StrS family aminotransferase [Phycisphaerae bacterium]|nr:DegT/DnrJ/EryC1/StrS family aminotransferase [Phycisphaerae bacterium]
MWGEVYTSMLADIPGVRPQAVPTDCVTNYTLYGVLIEPSEFGLSRSELAEALRLDGIGARPYFHPPVHEHPCYSNGGAPRPRELPLTKWVSARVLCLPILPKRPLDCAERIAREYDRFTRMPCR